MEIPLRRATRTRMKDDVKPAAVSTVTSMAASEPGFKVKSGLQATDEARIDVSAVALLSARTPRLCSS